MDIHEHTTPQNLERYAFLWSIARLVIAAFSLFFGAVPIAYKFGGYSGTLGSLLPLFWLVSGVAAVYLLYLWHNAGYTVLGDTAGKNKWAFLIMIVSGINLGYVAIGNTNIGIGLVWNMPVGDVLFKATAILYLFVAYHLWTNWKANGEHLFSAAQATVATDTSDVANNSEVESTTNEPHEDHVH